MKDIRSEIEKMNHIDKAQNRIDYNADDINEHSFNPFSIHHYRLGDKVITFSYETRYFESYLHPLICHFELQEENKEMPLFELFAYQERIVFRFN